MFLAGGACLVLQSEAEGEALGSAAGRGVWRSVLRAEPITAKHGHLPCPQSRLPILQLHRSASCHALHAAASQTRCPETSPDLWTGQPPDGMNGGCPPPVLPSSDISPSWKWDLNSGTWLVKIWVGEKGTRFPSVFEFKLNVRCAFLSVEFCTLSGFNRFKTWGKDDVLWYLGQIWRENGVKAPNV